VTAYYNEKDPYAAEWLRRLMLCSLIPWGDVDERSIEDVTPDDLKPYTRCHFFAGIGIWSLALQRAGWPDDRPIWTGSCPCQPFSAAGKGAGFTDERHLWPHWFHLIAQCRPPIILGEQVASKDGLNWLDLVSSDMEGAGYAVGASDLCAAGFGGAHIRQRLYFVGLANRETGGRREFGRALESGDVRHINGGSDAPSGVALPNGRERQRFTNGEGCQRDGQTTGRDESNGSTEPSSTTRGMADASNSAGQRSLARSVIGEFSSGPGEVPTARATHAPMLGRNAADWLYCRDGKWRPVESCIEPLANAPAFGMGRVCAGTIEALEKEIAEYAETFQRNPSADLRGLWNTLLQADFSEWPTGANYAIHPTKVLFAFVCQLAAQGWRFSESAPCTRKEASTQPMRVLWNRQTAASASYQRRLVGQPAFEPSNPLYFLSSLLARYAHSAWGEALAAHASARSPLAHAAPARVGRLRAYGNGLDLETATGFVEAVMECAP